MRILFTVKHIQGFQPCVKGLELDTALFLIQKLLPDTNFWKPERRVLP